MAYRKVHIGEDVWQYKVGSSHVHIKGPNNVSFTVAREQIGKETQFKRFEPHIDSCEDVLVTEHVITPDTIKKYIVVKNYVEEKLKEK